MTASDILSRLSQPRDLGIAVAVLLTLVQISPLKINPWSWLGRAIGRLFGWVGKAFIADIVKDIGGIRADLDNIKGLQEQYGQKLVEHIRVDDERDMDTRRQRILRFNADLMRGQEFDHEYFCDMLVEIDTYEAYCRTHVGYRNSRATMAIENIRAYGEEHERRRDWLVPGNTTKWRTKK